MILIYIAREYTGSKKVIDSALNVGMVKLEREHNTNNTALMS